MHETSITSNILLSVLTGIISGFISSALFFYIMSTLRPKIAIGAKLCQATDSEGTFYGFKIINFTKSDIVDVKLEFVLKTPFNSNGGTNNKLIYFNLRKDHLTQIPKFAGKDKSAEYAIVGGTRDNIEQLWKESTQYLVVKIQAKHSLSGITQSFEQKYYTKRSCIVEGFFNSGNTFEIS